MLVDQCIDFWCAKSWRKLNLLSACYNHEYIFISSLSFGNLHLYTSGKLILHRPSTLRAAATPQQWTKSRRPIHNTQLLVVLQFSHSALLGRGPRIFGLSLIHDINNKSRKMYRYTYRLVPRPRGQCYGQFLYRKHLLNLFKSIKFAIPHRKVCYRKI